MLGRDGSGYLSLPVEPMKIAPVVLEGQVVWLEPLRLSHLTALCEVGLDEDLWHFMPDGIKRTPADMEQFIATALDQQALGTALPLAIIERDSGQAIGSTRFLNIERNHHTIEIGATWIGRNWQRTAVNTAAKYLMLCHAFEALGCIRVELKTDVLNERSRRAILRIGAKQEGIFRNHIITTSGRIRDSVYFSIIDSEWPAVKAHLEEKLTHSD